MSRNVIEIGDKLHIITRRLFDGDIRRHFAGQVTAVSGDLHELQGYAFVLSQATNEFRKRPELRTRVFSLGNAGLIVFKIPGEVDLASLEYRTIDKRLVVTDGRGFSLDINEFGVSG